MVIEALVGVAIAVAVSGSGWVAMRRRRGAPPAASADAVGALGAPALDGVTHDLQNLFHAILLRLGEASHLPPDDLAEVLAEVQDAMHVASTMVRAMNGEAGMRGAGVVSLEGIVRLLARVHRAPDVPVHVSSRAPFVFAGACYADALHVVQNLLVNAVREARLARGGGVRVVVDRGGLRVTNAVRPGARLDDSIYERGVSFSGSTGHGLHVARAAAARLGWTLHHERHGGAVTFVVAPASPRVARAA